MSQTKSRSRGATKDKGLRHFSKIVSDKVEARKTTTYNEVADELVAEFNRTSDAPVDAVRKLRNPVLNITRKTSEEGYTMP
jgi:hypothetical protein